MPFGHRSHGMSSAHAAKIECHSASWSLPAHRRCHHWLRKRAVQGELRRSNTPPFINTGALKLEPRSIDDGIGVHVHGAAQLRVALEERKQHQRLVAHVHFERRLGAALVAAQRALVQTTESEDARQAVPRTVRSARSETFPPVCPSEGKTPRESGQ
eukprot:6214464-Pleurochrysis_carterae.AAC.3